jgi:hypothetical protein
MAQRLVLLLLMVLATSGCTSLYRPISALESDALSRSKRDVFPDDFRKSKVPMGSVEVAWAGVILGSRVTSDSDHYSIELEIQHHYFGWVEDNLRFHLSPRGEGRIRTVWSLVKSLKPETVENEIKPGRMIVIYGFPESLASEALVVKATYLRTFSPQAFRTNTMDYGRPGELVKLLKPWGVL